MTANAITGFRIIISLLMLRFEVFSPGFYACYLAAGISDMIDGSVARRLGTSSRYGEKLDTAADFVFAAAALYKLLPAISISKSIWIWIGLIAVIKLINLVSGFAVQKQFAAVHSPANKITGVVLFCLPLTLSVIDIKYSAVLACAVATFAAIQEGHIIRTGDTDNSLYF